METTIMGYIGFRVQGARETIKKMQGEENI